MTKKHRNWDIDLMRIVACFFVIFNHTGSKGFFLFSEYTIGGAHFWCYLFISVFCKLSVPLFFAISGALLLRKEESLQYIWKCRILKMFIVLIFFSFLYYLVDVFYGRTEFIPVQFFSSIYKTSYATAFWYMYAYIAFLITLPFLRALVANLEDKYFLYLAGFALFFSGILPIAEYILFHGSLTLYSQLKPVWTYSNIFIYPCLGYFFYCRFNITKYRRFLLLLWVCNIAAILISCFATYQRILITGKCSEAASQGFHSSFALLNCFTVFLTIKWLSASIKIPLFIQKLINSLGSCTFGIYLLHSLFLGIRLPVFSKLWNLVRANLPLNRMIVTFLICGIIMIIGYFLTLILKKIPGLRSLVS